LPQTPTYPADGVYAIVPFPFSTTVPLVLFPSAATALMLSTCPGPLLCGAVSLASKFATGIVNTVLRNPFSESGSVVGGSAPTLIVTVAASLSQFTPSSLSETNVNVSVPLNPVTGT